MSAPVVPEKKEPLAKPVVKQVQESRLVAVELVGGGSYHIMGGPSFRKGHPVEVSPELAEELLKTGLFKQAGGKDVPNTSRDKSSGS